MYRVAKVAIILIHLLDIPASLFVGKNVFVISNYPIFHRTTPSVEAIVQKMATIVPSSLENGTELEKTHRENCPHRNLRNAQIQRKKQPANLVYELREETPSLINLFLYSIQKAFIILKGVQN